MGSGNDTDVIASTTNGTHSSYLRIRKSLLNKSRNEARSKRQGKTSERNLKE